jgi:hypothetical protein
VSEVDDGEFLVIPSRPYLNVVDTGITLPEPAATGNTYGRVFTYRVADLPAAAQAYFRELPAKRWRRDTGWVDTVAEYDTTNLLAGRRDGSDLLPVTYLERTLLRHEGELLYANYRGRYARDDGSVSGKSFSSLLVSTDNGRSFQRRSTIAMDPADRDLMGEPHLAPTADGRLVCVIRRTDQDQKPMCITWSGDRGHTWSPVQRLFDFGVWPCVLLLGNGALVLSYGRPGVHLAVDPSGTGEHWPTQHTVIAGDHAARMTHSCGYTSLLPLTDDSFLIAYSDFLYTDTAGQPCKAILTRRVDVRRDR